MENWIVTIRERPGMSGKEIFIYRRASFSKIDVVRGPDIIETSDYGTDIKASIVLEPEMFQPLLEALLNNGVLPKYHSKIEGLLEAQTEHLNDLRHLLKLDQIINIKNS